jgi:hypothetical protein
MTIGQLAVGAPMRGGDYALDGVFWGVGAGERVSRAVYLPAVVR